MTITENLKKRVYTSLALLFLLYFILNFNFVLICCLLILGIISILEFFNLLKRIFINKFYLLIGNTIFTIYVFLFCLVFFFFLNIIQLKIIIISLLLGCIASDVGGFISGKIFKGVKLTKISPNKTFSGAIGSVIFSCATISYVVFLFTKNFDYKIIIIGISTSIFCQIGDLFFSLLKRKAKIKDTGNFLPGHGGVLDRLDGIYFGLPFGLLTLFLIY
jgi:phosphatidate cytidylyltransferase